MKTVNQIMETERAKRMQVVVYDEEKAKMWTLLWEHSKRIFENDCEPLSELEVGAAEAAAVFPVEVDLKMDPLIEGESRPADIEDLDSDWDENEFFANDMPGKEYLLLKMQRRAALARS